MYHQKKVQETWSLETLSPFDELILSWNAKRPVEGKYSFFVSAKVEDWSPWLLYATWGSEGQNSFKTTSEDGTVRVFQDALEVLEGKKATGFRVQISTEGDSSLDSVYGLHAYTNSDQNQDPEPMSSFQDSLHLKVQGLSQMRLDHPRFADLCSPTSSTTVTRYLAERPEIDPIHFAKSSWDGSFDIFGHWVFNVAQAASELGPYWDCWVERLSGFHTIYEQLQKGIPVVVSIRGPIQGSDLPYPKGHILVVTGYDSQQHRVLCMDPAFPSDDQTGVSYDFSDFIQAWNRRGKVAYIFHSLDCMYTDRDSRIGF